MITTFESDADREGATAASARHDPFGTRAWSRQRAERDRALRTFIDDFTTALATGDAERAEARARAISASEIVTNGVVLHDAIAVTERAAGARLPIDPDHPATVVALGYARLQAAGDVAPLHTSLRTIVDRLRRRSGGPVHERARDLAISAHAALLAGDRCTAITLAVDATDLVLDVEPEATHVDAAVLDVAAADLALVLCLADRIPDAMTLWSWLRGRNADPGSPALMQADWGLSIVGIVAGVRGMVSPTARVILDPDHANQDPRVATKDPWWAMVQAARAWIALDRLDGERALEITRDAVAEAATPFFVGPLILVHALALMVNGRSAAAVEFLAAADAATPHDADPAERPWRAAATAMAMAVTGDDLSEILLAFRDLPEMAAVVRAYAAIAQGDGDALGALGTHRPDERNSRLRLLYATVRAVAHLRSGNDGPALSALEEMAAVAEIHGVGAWQLIIPNADLVRLRELAADHDRAELCDALPDQTRVTAAAPRVELTDREQEVLTMIQRGMTNAQIARDLFISPNTVKFHVANLLRRLGVPNREAAAALGTQRRTRHAGRSGRVRG